MPTSPTTLASVQENNTTYSQSAYRLADKIGGKRALIISTVAFTVSSTTLGFVDDYWSYIAGSFIVGIASLGAHGIAYVYMTEVLGKSYLFFMPTIMNFRVGGSVLYGVVAYFAQVSNLIISTGSSCLFFSRIGERSGGTRPSSTF